MAARAPLLLLLLLLLLLQLLCSGHCHGLGRPGFVLTAPKRLLSGSTERLCLSLHGVSGPARVNISLLHLTSDQQICSTKSLLQRAELGGACLKLRVPPTAETGGRLHLQVRFDHRPEYVVSSVKEVALQRDPLLVLEQTDKPVYKGGQTVRFRVLALRHDLSPVADQIRKVWLENPARLVVAQWLNTSTRLGLAEFSFPLSPEPQIGTWHVAVQHGSPGPARRTGFQVLEYVLPRFQVTVRPPAFVLADAELLQWEVCARYSYGQPVKGVLHVKATPVTPTWRRNMTRSLDVYFTSKLRGEDGCELVILPGADLGLGSPELAPSHVALSAVVTEEGTGAEGNASATSAVLHRALRLSFLPRSARHFRPGLPYKGELKVSRQDGEPAASEPVQVCMKAQKEGELVRSVVACANFTSDSVGFVEFHVPPQPASVLLLSFVATAVNYRTKYYSPDKRWRVLMEQPSAFFDVQPWFSPSGSYLVITESGKAAECGATHSFQVFYTSDNVSSSSQNTFHYLVQSRGDVVHRGQTTSRGETEQPRLYTRFSNILGAQGDRMALERTTRSFSVRVPVTAPMSPLAQLLVYWVRADGELVAASHLLRVDQCFHNKVKAEFLKQRALPGEEVLVRVTASPASLCAVTAVDDSTGYVTSTGPDRLDSRLVFQQLDRFHVERGDRPRQVDEFEYCSKKQEQEAEEELEPPDWDLRRRRRSLVGFPTSTYADSLQAFEDFGAVVLSDLTLETRPCFAKPFDKYYGFLPGVDRSMGFLPGMDIADKVPLSSNPMNAMSPPAYPLTYGNSVRTTVPMDAAHQSQVEVRTFFPETWLWELVHVGSEGSAVLQRQLPHTVTDWVASTFCISPHTGLGVSAPTTVHAFQPFFLDFTAPFSVKRTEVFQLKVSLFNYLPHSLPVRVSLEQSAGVSLVVGQGSAVSCVQEGASWVVSFAVRLGGLGRVDVTVSAEVEPGYDGACGPDALPLARDTIVKQVLVKPEGFSVQKTKSALFCPADFLNDTSATWNLDVPADVVSDSASATVSVVADIMGPTLENLDNLVRLPKGCGEQNMVLFTPNIHVIDYLNATNQHNPIIYSQAISNLKKGYQRQLNYRHKDGSYSAFGSADDTGSMWLTAFVVKSFAQARRHIFLDEEAVRLAAGWISSKQLENGCFPVIGQVIHENMRGGLTTEASSAALTAYVVSALLEAGVPLSPAAASNAVFCLRGDREPNVYTLALTTYAFSLLGARQLAEESLRHLLAAGNEDGDLLWWEVAGANSLALDIETTAYALLTLVKLGGEANTISALKVVRWISRHRNADGGFVSTQDTVMALEALAKYATAIPSQNINLDVLVTAQDFHHRFQVRQHDRLLLKQQRLPTLPTQVNILADGRGCALVQAQLQYSVPARSGREAFALAVSTRPVASVDECAVQGLEVCLSYKPAGRASMVVLEVGLVTGFRPDRDSLHRLARDARLGLKRWEEQEEQVNFYFEDVGRRQRCVIFQVVRELQVDNPAPATVTVYDYYRTEMSASSTYNMQVGCKSEKLPNPQPDADWLVSRISTNTTTSETTSASAGPTMIQADSGQQPTSNGNSTTTGLNPQFVDVDHELSTPEGQEGPQPVYVRPSGYMATEARGGCPLCARLDSRLFAGQYCSSGAAYQLAVGAGGAATVQLALPPGRPPRRQQRPLGILLPAGCSCPPLRAEGSRVMLLSPRPLPGASVQLGPAHTVLSLPAGPGRPEALRAARRTCPT
ncbi:murinoglobulin-1-like [Bacillus rossius redtenbacheri]|uniref:murinoglobulin-1-like n=1 Tax=Bacillus rossius redtenbacheri TaxID=93214 RepID=UPI002FDE007A